jgi:hypothetical protein
MIGCITAGTFSTAGTAAPVLPITADLKMYYDASDASTLTLVSGRVSAIANKSPAPAQVLVQAVTTQQPLLVSAAYNGNSAMRLTNARNDLLYLNSTNLTGSAQTTFVVAKVTSTGNGYKFFFGNDTNYQMPLFYQLSQKTYYETSTGTSAITSSATTYNQLHIQMVRQNGTAVTQRVVFGATDETGTATAGGSLNVTSANTGIARSGLQPDFDFCEAVAYQAALSDSDITLVINYLKSKWGV